MAVPVATSIGAGTITSTNPLVITLTTAVAAGQSIVLRIANRTARTVSSITDSAGNTYVERVDASGGVGGHCIADCLNPSALSVGQTITITFSGSATAYAAATKLNATCTYVTSSAAGTAGNGSNPSRATGASIPVDSIVVGLLNWGSTTNAGVQSGWAGEVEASYGSRRFEAHNDDVTSAGTVTFAPTGLGTGSDYNLAVAAYTSPAGGSNYTLTADAGSFANTGSAASLLIGRTVGASAGAYALAGQDASFSVIVSYSMAADAGSLASTGGDAGLRLGRRVASDSGAASVAGSPAGLLVGRALSAAGATFGLSGAIAGVLRGLRIDAGAASFAATGASASLLVGHLVHASAGAVAVAGQDAALSVSAQKIITADAGAFALVATSATLTFTPVGAYGIIAESGAVSIAGASAGLRVARLVAANSGSIALAGSIAALSVVITVQAGPGAYLIQGASAELVYARRLAAEDAALSIVGSAANLNYAPGGIRYPTRRRTGFDQDAGTNRDNDHVGLGRSPAVTTQARLPSISAGSRSNQQRATVRRGN